MAIVHRDSFPAGQYFAAVAGMAMMRRILSRPSEGRPRLDDLRSVLEQFEEFPNNLVVEVIEHDVESGYTAWAPSYDGPNPAIDIEEPVVRLMAADLRPGTALDAACGTGRHAGNLAAAGHDVIGVDTTEAMLDVARAKYPEIDFRNGRLEALPIDDQSIDLVVSSLAVCHAPDLVPVFAEFARVLRPGGTCIVADPHPTMIQFGNVAGFRDRDVNPAQGGFTMPFVPNLLHPMHSYVNAARLAAMEVVECQEPTMPEGAMEMNPAYAVHPDAVRQAFGGLPFIVVWRFRKP